MGLDAIALIVASFGVVLGALSLFWQVWSSKFEGHLVVVETRFGMAAPDEQTILKFASITARNMGRASVQIDGWGAELGDGRPILWLRPVFPGNPSVPYRLESHASQNWNVPLAHFPKELVSGGGSVEELQIRGFVDLATGPRVRASAPLRLERDELRDAIQQGSPW